MTMGGQCTSAGEVGGGQSPDLLSVMVRHQCLPGQWTVREVALVREANDDEMKEDN